VLEIAERPVGGGEVLEGRAADLDGLGQDLLDRRGQRPRRFGGDAARRLERRDVGPVQGLAHIDVAQARDGALVQQQGLGALLAVGEGLFQDLGVEPSPSGSGPMVANQGWRSTRSVGIRSMKPNRRGS
jgi:hypothetical protein